MRRALLVGLVVPGLLMVACSDPVNSQKCTVEIESGCGTRLGLENEWVAEIAVTPWGLFVGSEGEYFFRVSPDVITIDQEDARLPDLQAAFRVK